MLPKEQRLEVLDLALDSVRRLWQRPADRRELLSAVGEPVELAMLRVLRAVERAEQEHPCVGDIAELLFIDASTASRLVEQVASAGYVAREPDARDRRKSRLSLTGEGKRLLARTTEVRRERVARATSQWSVTDIERLTRLLERLVTDAGSGAAR